MIDVGVFTGASSLAAALAVPKGGKVIACDVNEEYTKEAQKRWAEADVEDIVDLRIAPAAETLQSLIDAGEAGSYDFAFIDADKLGYDSYYELCLQLLRPGGEDIILIFVDIFNFVLKPSQNKKDRKFVSAAPKMASFFTAGS